MIEYLRDARSVNKLLAAAGAMGEVVALEMAAGNHKLADDLNTASLALWALALRVPEVLYPACEHRPNSAHNNPDPCPACQVQVRATP